MNVLPDAPRHPAHGVRLEGVTKRFGKSTVLKGIDLTVEDGELLVLLGPSGCGKTTTMNVMAGVETVDAGRIWFGNQDVTRVAPERRDVSMVFQSVGLYPHLDVRRNITFPLRLKKVPRRMIDERTDAIVELLGIAHLMQRRIHEISGGERQRVAIAKALVKRPRLFLLDEPFSSLDAEVRRQLRIELVRIHAELRTTMVFVTHDQEEAISVGSRIAVMNGGSLIQLGPPLEVYQNPESTWVARFIGTHPINLLPVRLTDGAVMIEEGAPLRLDGDPAIVRSARAAAGRELVLGLRPESVVVVPSDDPDATAGQIVLTQMLGNSILYEIRLANGAMIRAYAPSSVVYPVEANVGVKFLWSGARFFDRESQILLEESRGPDAISLAVSSATTRSDN